MRASGESATRAGAALGFIVLAFTGCKPQPLPEASTPPAQLYQLRCGACHAPYSPRAMTAAMWQTQVEMMQSKMHDAGMAPLSDAEKESILDYLTRNAGTD